jgi:hypothetical protein
VDDFTVTRNCIARPWKVLRDREHRFACRVRWRSGSPQSPDAAASANNCTSSLRIVIVRSPNMPTSINSRPSSPVHDTSTNADLQESQVRGRQVHRDGSPPLSPRLPRTPSEQRLSRVRSNSFPSQAMPPEPAPPAIRRSRSTVSMGSHSSPAAASALSTTDEVTVTPKTHNAISGDEDSERWRRDPALARNRDTDRYVKDSRDHLSNVVSESELDALVDYFNYGFAMYNMLMRNGLRPSSDWKEMVDRLVQGGLGVNHVFRGVADHQLVVEGQTYVDLGLGSSSYTMPRALFGAQPSEKRGTVGVALHMFDAAAGNISGASHIPEEAEALVAPGRVFDVLLKEFDRKSGVYHAVLAGRSVNERNPISEASETEDVPLTDSRAQSPIDYELSPTDFE